MNEDRPTVFVVVPTYWGPATGAIYDHPTPLDGESTLVTAQAFTLTAPPKVGAGPLPPGTAA